MLTGPPRAGNRRERNVPVPQRNCYPGSGSPSWVLGRFTWHPHRKNIERTAIRQEQGETLPGICLDNSWFGGFRCLIENTERKYPVKHGQDHFDLMSNGFAVWKLGRKHIVLHNTFRILYSLNCDAGMCSSHTPLPKQCTINSCLKEDLNPQQTSIHQASINQELPLINLYAPTDSPTDLRTTPIDRPRLGGFFGGPLRGEGARL